MVRSWYRRHKGDVLATTFMSIMCIVVVVAWLLIMDEVPETINDDGAGWISIGRGIEVTFFSEDEFQCAVVRNSRGDIELSCQ